MPWTLDQLSAEAALALSNASLGQPSARVSDVPTPRSIRFYTTHGLLDRPDAYEGRTALYGRRHLLQLVAIKRLQARGEALVAIQHKLVGLDDAALAEIAELEPQPAEARAHTKRTFWSELPAGAPPPPPVRSRAPHTEGLELAPGVMLLLEKIDRDVYEDDLAAIRAAAAPLLKLLDARHLRARAPNPEKGERP